MKTLHVYCNITQTPSFSSFLPFTLSLSQSQCLKKPFLLFSLILAPDFPRHILFQFFGLFLQVQGCGDLSHFFNKFVFVVFGAGVEVDDCFLHDFEPVAEVPDIALILEGFFFLGFLDLLYEPFEIHRQQFQQIFLIFFILSQRKVKGILSRSQSGKIRKRIDPLQLLTAFDSKFIGGLHELALGEIDIEHVKEVLSFGEDVDSFVVVGHGLVENEPFCAVVHLFHDFFLAGHHLIWFFFVDVAFEVVFVVGLPGLRTHVAEIFAAGAGHEVAAH